jgi:hypothetical protein
MPGLEPGKAVLSQKYLAGQEGIEPSIEVLETPVIPFNYWPIWACLELRDPVGVSFFFEKGNILLGETAGLPLTDTPIALLYLERLP